MSVGVDRLAMINSLHITNDSKQQEVRIWAMSQQNGLNQTEPLTVAKGMLII